MAPVALGTSITPGANAVFDSGHIAGEALTNGNLVYRDPADSNKLKKADQTSATKAQVFGVVIGTVASGSQVLVQTKGTVTGTATLVQGEHYGISGTAGSIEPAADEGTGDFWTYVGYAPTTTSLELAIHHAAVARA